MSDFEVMSIVVPVTVLAVIVYIVINILSFKDIMRRVGLMKISRRDFYECGVKPQNKKPVKVSLQFLLICVFFILYDIELIYLFPFVSGFSFSGLYNFTLISFFFSIFISSLTFDYTRHALVWQE
jgi:NADH:ubiquinone oxidoreductase subunit 3 (subunit A)